MNPRDRLQYALYLQRLHELFVIKENIAFQYPNAHYNKAAEQIDKVVDKCLDNNIKAVVEGTHNLETPNLDHVISGALSSQQKMLVKTKDKYIQNAVEQNTKEFTRFIQNRIEKENYSLQAKIQKEYEKKKYKGMPEEEAKKLIREKFQDSARKRSKNIVKDAVHTNQSQISWTYNLNNGMKYKVWMNGQGKSKVRDWHIKSKILPVEIDDFFDIFGPKGHAQMMYPGDLNGGAENVANCRCWLHYTNTVPSNLKKKGTVQINPNVNLENENTTTFSANTEKKGLFTKIRDKISDFRESISNKIKTSKTESQSTLRSLFSLDNPSSKSNTENKVDVNTVSKDASEVFSNIDVSYSKKLLKKFDIIKNKYLDDTLKHFQYFKNKLNDKDVDKNIEHCTIRRENGEIIEFYDDEKHQEVNIPPDIQEEGRKGHIHTVIHSHPEGTSPLSSPEDIRKYAECGVINGISHNELGTMTIVNNDIKGNKEIFVDIEKKVEKIRQGMIDDFCVKENEGKPIDWENKEDKARLNRYVDKNSRKYVSQYKKVLKPYKMEVKFNRQK